MLIKFETTTMLANLATKLSIVHWYLDASDNKHYTMKQEEEPCTLSSMLSSTAHFTCWLPYFPKVYNIPLHEMNIGSSNHDLKWGC